MGLHLWQAGVHYSKAAGDLIVGGEKGKSATQRQQEGIMSWVGRNKTELVVSLISFAIAAVVCFILSM